MMNQNVLQRLVDLKIEMIKREKEKKEKRRQTIAIIEANIMSLESYPDEQTLARQIIIYKKIVELLKENEK